MWTGQQCSMWEMLLTELQRKGREIIWIKVPSHVTIEGNDEADSLAAVGLHAHPVHPFHQTPRKEAMLTKPPPPQLKRARKDPCTLWLWTFLRESTLLLPHRVLFHSVLNMQMTFLARCACMICMLPHQRTNQILEDQTLHARHYGEPVLMLS